MAGSYGGMVQTAIAVGLQAARPASLRCLPTGADRVVGWICSLSQWKLLSMSPVRRAWPVIA